MLSPIEESLCHLYTAMGRGRKALYRKGVKQNRRYVYVPRQPSTVVFSEPVDNVNLYTEEFLVRLALEQLAQLEILKQVYDSHSDDTV